MGFAPSRVQMLLHRPGGRSEHFKIHEVPELEPQSCGVHAVATTVDVIA